MKHVLLTTFPSAFLHYGGGEREIHLLNEAFNKVGLMSDIYGPSSKSLSAYQAVIHFSMNGGSEQIIDSVFSEGLPLILWPNLWFVNPPTEETIDSLSGILSKFRAVVFRSAVEEAHFRNYFDISNLDAIRIGPLVSPKFLRKNITPVFQDSYSFDDYAIWPGIIEPRKNQLAAVKAFKEIECSLVISGWIRDKAYAEECMRQAGPNVHFIPNMLFGSELHLSALAFSKLHIELPFDFPGTSALETAAMGGQLLLTKSEWTDEMLGNYCWQVEPHDISAIRESVISILSNNSQIRQRKIFCSSEEAISPLVEYLENLN